MAQANNNNSNNNNSNNNNNDDNRRKKPKTKNKDPTNQSIPNGASFTVSKEERWLRIYPEESLKIIKNDPETNLECRACSCFLKCLGIGDLKKHLCRAKHAPAVKKWKEDAEKKSQPKLAAFRSIGEYQQERFIGFMFTSFLCNLSGNGATKMKPLAIDCEFSITSSNAAAPSEVISRAREQFGLKRKDFRYFLGDGVAYNCKSFKGLAAYFPHIHQLLSPLHLVTNGVNDGIDKTPKRVIGLVLDVMKKGPQLFSKSMKRRRELKSYLEGLNSLRTDPLIVQLFDLLSFEDFCQIYDLPQSEEYVELLVFGGDDEECDESSCLYLQRKCCLTSHPPRKIKNKWKAIIFCVYYWWRNLRNFIAWCVTYFDNEDFFCELTELEILQCDMQFAFLFDELKPVMLFIITVEKRGVIGHLMWYKMDAIKQSFEEKEFKDLSDDLQGAIDEYCEECPDFTVIHTDAVQRERVMEKFINKLRQHIFDELSKQFSLRKPPLKLLKNLGQFDPFNTNQESDVLVALSQFKHGPQSFGNQLTKLSKAKKQWTIYHKIICPYIRDELSRDEILRKKLLREGDLEILDKFVNQDRDKLDILSFLRCYVMRHLCGWLSLFGVDVLNHPMDTCDAERFVRYLTLINSNVLTKQLAPQNKAVRLLAMWNSELVLKNICH